jgi:hypothetical protein
VVCLRQPATETLQKWKVWDLGIFINHSFDEMERAALPEHEKIPMRRAHASKLHGDGIMYPHRLVDGRMDS